MSLLRGGGGGAYAQDKNTSVRVCAKNAGGAYLRDTTVIAGEYMIVYSFPPFIIVQPPLYTALLFYTGVHFSSVTDPVLTRDYIPDLEVGFFTSSHNKTCTYVVHLCSALSL